MDREEIYAPMRQQMLAALCVLGVLLVAGALLVALLWRPRSALFLEREHFRDEERSLFPAIERALKREHQIAPPLSPPACRGAPR